MYYFCVDLIKRGQAISEKTLFVDFYNALRQLQSVFTNINGRDVQRKNVVNNVDKSSLWAP